MSRLLTLLILAFALVGCMSAPPASPLCQRCRPQLALIPVINGTNVKLPWNIEREITDDILDCLMSEGLFWVSPLNQFESAVEQTRGRDYFGIDLSFANHFSHNDFLVIAELIEHDRKPYNRTEYPDLQISHTTPDKHQVLALAIRLRVIDLRFEEPQIIRQEIIEIQKIVTAKAKSDVQMQAVIPAYESTPLAKGHREIAALIAEKIEEAIFCSW